jgi:hypothetical protein
MSKMGRNVLRLPANGFVDPGLDIKIALPTPLRPLQDYLHPHPSNLSQSEGF